MIARSVRTFAQVAAMIATVLLVILVVVTSPNTEASGTTYYVATDGSAVPTTLSQTLLFVGDFETGDRTGFYNEGNEPTIVSSGHPVRAGTYSLRCYVHRTESDNKYRTMLVVRPNDQTPFGDPHSEFTWDIGEECWTGFSIYIPADWVTDPRSLGSVIWQGHATPDPGEEYRSPPVALGVDSEYDNGGLVPVWRIDRLWDTRAFSPGFDWEHRSSRVLNQPLGDDIGRWTDWVFHIIWDYDSDGLLEVWHNGTQVLNISGGNCSNDNKGPYPSFGMYKWPWRPDQDYETNSEWRLLYFDEFRIGDANATYEDVIPPTALILPRVWLPLVLSH